MPQRQNICPILTKDKEGMLSYWSGFLFHFQVTFNLYEAFLGFGKEVPAELPRLFSSALTSWVLVGRKRPLHCAPLHTSVP